MLFVIAILYPIISGLCVSMIGKDGEQIRNKLYAFVMISTDVLVILAMFFGTSIRLFQFSDYVTVDFRMDSFGRYVLIAVLLLYTVVTFYSFEYMNHDKRPRIFYGCMFVSLGALIGLCLSGNLITMYLCFEFVTLSSFPLVLHVRTKEAVTAGMKYMYYSIAGALMGLLSVFFVYYYGQGTSGFVLGGYILKANITEHYGLFLAMVFVGIIGFGTKAGLLPMSGWLPTAHPIAPAPGSALMSGIIAKAGLVAVIRLVYYSVGPRIIRDTWVQYAWMILAMLTILMGSSLAFQEKITKKRLAYSTISQISYIMLGLSILSNDVLEGGVIQLMSHLAAKGCLFLAAGVFIHQTGKTKVPELKGVGKQMPVTLACFAAASLSLIGIPPFGGFTGKWIIAEAAMTKAPGFFAYAAPAVLMISAFLTAGYLMPVVVDGFFPGKDIDPDKLPDREPGRFMTIPMIILCCMALFMGLFGAQFVNII